jgi:four helix bundle protein
MQPNDLRDRTKQYAIRIVKLTRALPQNYEGSVIGHQLLRCGTSVAANYRAVCRARSMADFISKLGVVIEEADESVFWMELIIDLKLITEELIEDLLKEGTEILAIMIASSNSAQRNKK